ncbi:IclR family transcriptional regulator [Streptomyces sp. 8N706]|uniref:IclR family transcriptional regulator n=1 Tax=Streptomyces sp. 8N706 TaxID=3457416 RepID=UPI003FD37480
MPEGQALQSVERAMAVLDAAAVSGGPVTAKALARELGCALSTAYNLANTLVGGGYLEHVDGGYVLGDRVSALHCARARQDRTPEGVRGVLERVRRATGTSVYYSRFRDGGIVVESASQAPGPAPAFPLGPDPYAHATAHGKVLLAGLAPHVRRRYLEGAGMPRLTGRTITHAARLDLHLQQVRRTGFAIAVEESVPGEACLSVPVTPAGGRVLGALSVALPSRTLAAHRERLVSALRRAAHETGHLLAEHRTP